jgi:ornithine--oxo-acid transaminase
VAPYYCEALRKEGVLVRQVGENILRFMPPFIITKKELNWTLKKIVKVIAKDSELA